MVFRRLHLPTYQRRRKLVHQASTLTPDITTGVEFDGTNDYLLRGAGLTGAVDGKEGTLAFVFSATDVADTRQLLRTDPFTISIQINSSGQIFARGNQVGGTAAFQMTSTSGDLDDGEEHAVMIAWDAAGGAAYLYVDDAQEATTTPVDANIDYTVNEWSVGATETGSIKLTGCLAELFLALEYVDPTVEANRRKFFDANGLPVDKGSDGSTPTGTQPILYLSGGADQFATNFGSGGAFTVTGALVDCALEIAQTITATLSIGAAIQAQRTLAASLSGAIQQGRTLTAGVDAAIAQALSALTSASAAIATTNTATFSLDAALQEAKSATADANAVIQAVQTAAASLQGAIQTGQTSSAQVGAAVAALMNAQVAVDAVIQATMTASVGLSANINEEGVNLATAVLSGAIQALQSASAGLTGAIQGAGSAQASVSAAIAAVRSVTATIDAVIAQIVTATPSVDGAILASMSATASLSARIFALGEFTPSLSRMHTAGRQSRTIAVPARTRRH